jgi:hypothetical protein
MYVRGYLQGSENGRVVTIALNVSTEWLITMGCDFQSDIYEGEIILVFFFVLKGWIRKDE